MKWAQMRTTFVCTTFLLLTVKKEEKKKGSPTSFVRIPVSPSVRTRDSAGGAGANHLPEFMSGDVSNGPDGAGGHPV